MGEDLTVLAAERARHVNEMYVPTQEEVSSSGLKFHELENRLENSQCASEDVK